MSMREMESKPVFDLLGISKYLTILATMGIGTHVAHTYIHTNKQKLKTKQKTLTFGTSEMVPWVKTLVTRLKISIC